MRLETIRQKTRELRARTRRELLGNVATVLIVMGASAFSFAGTREPALRVMCLLAVLWSVVGQYFLHRGMWAATRPGDAALTTGLEFYRREIKRRSHMFRRVIQWSLAPVILSISVLILVLTGIAENRGLSGRSVMPFCTLFAVWIVGVLIQRSRSQRALRRELAELDSFKQDA